MSVNEHEEVGTNWVFVFILATIAIFSFCGAGIGYDIAERRVRQQAIAAGVAEYRLKSADGTETEFVWKKP